jgi:hypothetical protein
MFSIFQNTCVRKDFQVKKLKKIAVQASIILFRVFLFFYLRFAGRRGAGGSRRLSDAGRGGLEICDFDGLCG